MKLLAPLRRSTESRYSIGDLAEWITTFNFNGLTYGAQGVQTTYGRTPTEPIADNFTGLVQGALRSNGVVAAVELVRVSVFSEARFQFQQLRAGRPGELFGTEALAALERPWPGGTTGDLLARMLLDADFAGNAFVARLDDEFVRLRPDWVDIVLQGRMVRGKIVGYQRFGYQYFQDGDRQSAPTSFLADEIAHFAPMPDPVATYRGMSWLTPVIREIMADGQATKHKLKFFENAATPNLAVNLKEITDPDVFEMFVEKMSSAHDGVDKAYKTLYTAGGADVTVIGADMRQIDFKVTQGAGETRIAAAAGVHPVIVGLSEGLAGSSLNAGNFGQARRRFADGTLRPLWRNIAGSLETLVPPPPASRLWYDDRDIGFLREDEKDAAEIEQIKAGTIANLVKEGFTSESAVAAVDAQDMTLLVHTGLVSVQLQAPGTQSPTPDMGASDDSPQRTA
jgi:hypothetical protein